MEDQVHFESYAANPFDALTLAHRENVHSAMLAWLLRTRQLPVESRRDLLRAITGISNLSVKEVDARTEWDDLDILVEVSGEDAECPGLVAIENKLKAQESETQLAKYDQRLADDGRRVLRKVFLSFIGNAPRGGHDWIPRSYDQLLDGLDKLASATSNQYVSDYRDVVKRLAACRRLVRTSLDHAEYIFYIHGPSGFDRGFADYVEASRLRVTLQCVWLAELAKQVNSSSGTWSFGVGETNGAGLLNASRRIERKHRRVEFGVQFQRGKFKAFAQPAPYLKSTTEPERAAVEQVLSEIKDALALDSKVLATNDRGRGFRSFAIKPALTRAQSINTAACAARLELLLKALERLAPN